RRRQSRLTRLKVAAVALAAALLAGGGTMVLQGSDDPAPPVATGTQVEEMVAAVDWVPVAAQLRIAEEDTGTTIAMDCRYQSGYTGQRQAFRLVAVGTDGDRKSTRLNSSHVKISYAVFCLKKKK